MLSVPLTHTDTHTHEVKDKFGLTQDQVTQSKIVIFFIYASTDAVICYFDMRKQGNKLSVFIAATLIQLWESTPIIMIHDDHARRHQQCLVYKNKASSLP